MYNKNQGGDSAPPVRNSILIASENLNIVNPIIDLLAKYIGAAHCDHSVEAKYAS